ncbi:MAG: endonuclease/exonuclease/phosphatase family protein [Chloroflexi bacterium]|nr:endonuclease/exonuclease/phosphatase family protein [Chloroflexota bacterium]MDA1228249.1 endonuclease/exonuclease/phosphatase family protein [Chloroflexota bacterium]
MTFRISTLNLEQDHKRWDERRYLVLAELGRLKSDVFCMNEVCIPRQTGRWLQVEGGRHAGHEYSLAQQSRPGAMSLVDGEGVLTRFNIVETANLDYRAGDAVAQVARLQVEGKLVDVYVTHLFRSTGEDSLRTFQAQRLLEWTKTRDDVDAKIVCGDFNATLDMPSAALMASEFTPTQTAPTAFTPLADVDGEPSHPYWERFDRCIDYIWVSDHVGVVESGVCFAEPSPDDPTLWPSDHAGVWADLEFA